MAEHRPPAAAARRTERPAPLGAEHRPPAAAARRTERPAPLGAEHPPPAVSARRTGPDEAASVGRSGGARLSRRAALRAGGLAVVGAALAPAVASGAIDEGGLLLGLWRREMGAALAYDRVAHLHPLFVTLRGHEADHAAAIATELAAVGLGLPRAPQWVSEIDAGAERLALADATSAIGAAALLEVDLIALYRTAVPALGDANIAMTAATILASHSQHLLILQRETDGG